jgi:glycosyltransferase involved in cell wall biosynthesis
MKIFHVIDSGGLYGAEVMLLYLMEEQCRMGLEPILASIGDPCCGEKPLEAEARRRGLRVEPFRMRPGPNIAGAFHVLRFARHEEVDLLHSHGYKGNILFGLMPKSIRRIPMVATLHGWTSAGRMNRMWLYEWLDRLSLCFIDRVVIVNGAMRDRVKLKRIHVVDNGIPVYESDISGRTEDEKHQVDPEIKAFCHGGFTIGAIGRLSKEKGFGILLDALKEVADKYPEVRLLILGEGSERVALKAKTTRLGLEDRVLMPGYVANARDYLHLFGVFAMPSLTEGLPIVLLEAMQAGVPIVASRVGGMPDVLAHGRAGLLIEPGSIESVKQGISEVLRAPAAAELRMREAGQRVREEFSSRTMTNKYLEIYRRVVQSSSRSYRTHQTRQTQ